MLNGFPSQSMVSMQMSPPPPQPPTFPPPWMRSFKIYHVRKKKKDLSTNTMPPSGMPHFSESLTKKNSSGILARSKNADGTTPSEMTFKASGNWATANIEHCHLKDSMLFLRIAVDPDKAYFLHKRMINTCIFQVAFVYFRGRR